MPRETYEGHELNYMRAVEPPDSDTSIKVANYCYTCAAEGNDPAACEKIAQFNAEQTPTIPLA